MIFVYVGLFITSLAATFSLVACGYQIYRMLVDDAERRDPEAAGTALACFVAGALFTLVTIIAGFHI